MSLPRGRPTQLLKFLLLIWAWLWHRPTRTILGLVSISIAFTLYGLAMGVAEGFYRMAAVRGIDMGPDFLLGAAAASAIGFILILFLTTNVMAQSVRLRIVEFGVLKAIGFSHRLIMLLVAAESVLPCLIGALIGLVMAKLLFSGAAMVLPPLARFPAPIYTPGLLAIAAGLAILIGCVSAIPAARIIRLEAAAALAGGLRSIAGSARHTAREKKTSDASPSALQLHDPVRRDDIGHLHLARQIMAVTRTGLSTLPQRFKSALVIVIGVGVMVFVLLSFLSMAEGMRLLMLGSGDPARVMVHRLVPGWRHAFGEVPSDLPGLIAAAPGVARTKDGAPMLDVRVTLGAGKLVKRNNGENNGNTNILGVGPHWREMSPSLHLLSGRMPRPGMRELLAGELAQRKFSDLDDGIIEWEGSRWRIVGTFADADWRDGWLVGDAKTLKAATKQPGTQTILVRLVSPAALEDFRKTLQGKLPPGIVMESEPEHYAQGWKTLAANVPAFYIAYFLAGLIGMGAIAGTMHTMHGAMEARAREIAILRAVGFDGAAVAASAMVEAMLLAMLGACLGTAGIWLWLDGFLYNGAGGVFVVTVNWRLLAVGNCWGLTVALLGTLSLAIRAARQTPIEALREV